MPPSAARPAIRSVRPKADPPPAPDRLRWRAYESFRQHLLASRIRPGQFISQRELAALTGLPLGAIREVIPRLEAEGLLVTVPQRGLQIANVDVKLIHNAFLLRLILEREAAAQFAHTVSDDELDRSKPRTATSSPAPGDASPRCCSTLRAPSTGACTTQ